MWGLLAFLLLWMALPAVLHADPQPAAGRVTVAAGAARNPSAARAPHVQAGVLIVQSGDTLWSLAERLAPDEDPRVWIAAVRRVNDLDSAVIRPGQRLRVPGADGR
ncbi:MAG: LysM peptidoglycan-binding domain-containing protein [Firmicutes bacterium]|nr:LysM peptidoglycan-binding domain-containing protein [Bacillota bacterium]